MTTQYVTGFNEHKRGPHEKWYNSGRKKAKTSQKPYLQDSEVSDFLMLHQGKMREKRSDSLDVIPACVPDSVGLEIENILQNSFSGRHYLENNHKVHKIIQ